MTDQASIIPKGWKMTTLDDVTDKIGDGLHGTPGYSNNGEYFFINGNNIENGRIVIKNNTNKVDREEFGKHKKDLGENTILLSINGTIGNLAKYKNEKCILGKSAAYINVKNENSQNFIYYLMLDNRFQRDISKNANGSTIKNVSLAQLRNYKFILPPLLEQRAIATVLSSLDDQTELLREQNKTLEATAQEIFKEWFVNFNFPNATGKTIDSELGEIPEGWRVDSLSKIAVFLNGLALQKFPPESASEYLPVIKIRELSAGVSAQTDRASARLDKKYIVEDGDILFSWSGSLVVDIWKYGKGALNQHLFKVTSEDFPKWFYYHWTKEHLASFQQTATAKAVTMGHIQRHHLDDALVVIPDEKFLKIADTVFSPMLEKFISNNSQIQIVSTLRDTLLPKLMKGEVRVEGFKN